MADLQEDATWVAGVYQLEDTDPVSGGPPNLEIGDGMDNVPHQQLAKRTSWLKAQVDLLISTVVAATTSVAGIVRLSTSVTSTSTTMAATPSAVKAAFDNAEGRVPTSRLVATGGLATGGGNLLADRTITVPVASASEAAAGTSNTVAMTPLRVAEAIRELPNGTVGEIAAFARETAPTGWLKANGAIISRTSYAALFAVIGTRFGPGDGSTTFALPDMRGEFLRGWDDGRGVDADRGLGSYQGEAFKSHTHTGTTETAGAHTHYFKEGAGATTEDGDYVDSTTNQAGTAQVTTSSAGSHSHSFTTNDSGGNETRPRNRAFLICIKF